MGRSRPRLRVVEAPQRARQWHVCLVAPFAWPVFIGDPQIQVMGGAELQQSILARALAAAGQRVTMVCLDFGQPARVTLDGVTVIKAHRVDSGIPVLRFLHPRMTSVWSAMRRADADIYYFRCASLHTALGSLFCRTYGRKAVYAGASDVDFIPGRQQIRFARDRWLFEYGLRRVDAIVAQNASQYENCRAHYSREAVIIPSCYKPPSGALADPQGYVLWAGAMRAYKRPELVLEIARRLPQRRFVMAGGPDRDDASSQACFRRIEAEAKALGNVEVAGFVPFARIERLFDGAALLLNTSEYEGMPNTFLQAWARGIPSVGFVDTGSRHAGRPLYPVAQDAAGAAQEIDRLLGERARWHEASRRSREYFAAHHSVEAVTERYVELFSQLVDAPVRT